MDKEKKAISGNDKEAIILFDGVCNFCNDSVNFIIKRDSKRYFKFAPLQTEFSDRLLKPHGIDSTKTDSIILIENEQIFTRSTAVLKIASSLDGIWSAFYIFIITPRPIRDLFYVLFTKYRYKLFGKKDMCMIPTPEVRERFLG